jgi:diguanylate cyclase (GGDEF)-like protein
MELNLLPMLWLVGFQMGLYALAWVMLSALLREDRGAVAHWGIFMLLIGAVMLLAGSRGEPRAWLFYNGANVLSLVAFAVVRRGIERFMQVPSHDIEQMVVLVVVGGAVALVGADESAASSRVVLTYGCQGYIMLRAMWAIRAPLRAEFGTGAQLAIVVPGLLISGMLALLALRQALDLAHPVEMQRNVRANYALMYYYLAGTALFNFGFMVLLTQRLVVKLQQSSRRDALTGLFNRRVLDEEIERLWLRFQRRSAAFATLLVDVDHFKQINDSQGHAAGDAVLKHLASLFQEHARATDVVGRMGGDEFLILLPDVRATEAARFAERLRRLVEEGRVRKVPSRATISIGIAAVRADDGGPEHVIARADGALYRAKTGGRNRIEVEDAEAFTPVRSPRPCRRRLGRPRTAMAGAPRAPRRARPGRAGGARAVARTRRSRARLARRSAQVAAARV